MQSLLIPLAGSFVAQSESDYRGLGLQEHVLHLASGDLRGGGVAVISYASAPPNSKAVLWLPGLDSSFHQVRS